MASKKGLVESGPVATCPACGKGMFTTPKAAKVYGRKRWPGSKFGGYECPGNPGAFHYGRLKESVRRGNMPRALIDRDVVVYR